jgi:hypothetical protein
MEEKIALVTRIHQLYSTGRISLKAAAAAAGTTDSSYKSWLRAGVRPAVATASVQQEAPQARRQFDDVERKRLKNAIEQRIAAGEGVTKACLTEGIDPKTYQRWLAAEKPPLAMRPVEVRALVPVATALPPALAITSPRPAPTTSSDNLSLVAPGGYRVEGLNIETTAQLLKALTW